jgi:hypothetical protein
MTKLFERAVETVRGLPPEAPDAVARIVLQLAREKDLPPIAMSAEDVRRVAGRGGTRRVC